MRTLTKLLAAAPLGALLLLAACGGPETVTSGDIVDPDAEKVKAAPPVTLPPSVAASKAFRCKDNSLVYVDFMSDGTSANLRATKGGTPTALTAPAAGQAYVGGGNTLSGSAAGSTIQLDRPGKGSQSCKA